MHLHSRITRPVVSLMSVFLVIPLILRREKDNLVANILTCTLTLALVWDSDTAWSSWPDIVGSARSGGLVSDPVRRDAFGVVEWSRPDVSRHLCR